MSKRPYSFGVVNGLTFKMFFIAKMYFLKPLKKVLVRFHDAKCAWYSCMFNRLPLAIFFTQDDFSLSV